MKFFAKAMDDHPGFQLPFPLQNSLPVALNSEVGVKTIPGGPDLKSGAILGNKLWKVSSGKS